jgi:hypothetical protein
MTTLDTNLAAYRTAKQASEIAVAGDPRTRPGREMVRNKALQELPALKESVVNSLTKVGTAFFLQGSEVSLSEFITKAGDLAPSVVVDLGKVLASAYQMTTLALGNSTSFGPSAFTVMLRELRQAASRVGMKSMPDISFDGLESIQPDQVEGLVNRYVAKYLGTEFLVAAVHYLASEYLTSTQETYPDPVVPVFVLGATDRYRELLSGLYEGKMVVLNVPAAFDEAFVVTALQEAKELKESKKRTKTKK